MGQRHQIYIKLPKIYVNENNPNNRDERIIAFHHQWLYGATACEVLYNFMSFYKRHVKKQTYDLFSSATLMADTEEVCSLILSYFPNNAGFEKIHNITDSACTTNPHYGDNNDGLTVIDLSRKDDPRYCFASLGYTEGRVSLREGAYSAKEYLCSYWREDQWSNVVGRGGHDLTKIMRKLGKYQVISFEDLKGIFPDWQAV